MHIAGRRKNLLETKFRIYPNKEQEELLAKTFGCCRFLYNRILEDKFREMLCYKLEEKGKA